jgi:hypothetical protein
VVVCLGAALAASSTAGASGARAATSVGGRLSGIPGTAVPSPTSGTRALGLAAPTATISTDVFLSGRSAALTAFAASVSTPGSSDYKHFLTPAQVQARFGATPAQVTAVEQWLRGDGLTVTRISPQEITATGTTTQTDAAYDTTLERYSDSNGDFTAPGTAASLPASVSGAVLSVLGLSTRQALMRPEGLAKVENAASSGTIYLGSSTCSSYFGQLTDTTDPQFNGANQPYQVCGYVPSQMRSAYGVTQGNGGKGVTVAVVDAYSNTTLAADANEYSANRGEPAFTAGQFSVTTDEATWADEGECGGAAGWAGEQALDIEAVHAIAPAANVAYYGANSCLDPDFIVTLGDIINNHLADVITDSWGEPISDSYGNVDPAAITAYTALFKSAAAEGIEVSFSTGDCGAEDPTSDCGSGDGSTGEQTDYPDSDAWVTAVGGNSVEIGQAGTVERELPWGSDYSTLNGGSWVPLRWTGGGGGGTTTFAQPSYQSDVVPTSLSETELNGTTSATPLRVVPDLSLDAAPATGLLIGFTQSLPAAVGGGIGYAEVDYGGTSLASPLFAGLVADGISDGALARGFLNPTLYSVYTHDGSRFFDDTVDPASGTNPAEIGAPWAVDGTTYGFTFASDRPLTATTGFDNATGLGMPTADFLSLGDTATRLAASQNPAALGAPVTFTATVAPTAQSVTPSGTVQFYADGTPAGAPVTLSGGSATSAPVSGLGVGSHSIRATFTGDVTDGLLASTSSALPEVLKPLATGLSALTLTGIDPVGSRGQISAKLSRTDSGAALAGQAVSFTTGGTELCSGTTGTDGVGGCSFAITRAISSSLLSAGYVAVFGGAADYASATATAALPAGEAITLPVTNVLGSANHTAAITLSCASNATGCNVVTGLYNNAGTLLGKSSVKLRSGAALTVEVPLNSAARRLTSARGPLAARLRITSQTGTGKSQTQTYPVTVKPLKASLLGAVPGGGAAARAASVLAARGYHATFTALFAGTLNVEWYVSVTGKGDSKPSLEKVAAGNASFAIAGTQTVTTKLTVAGAARLQHFHGRRLIAKVSFRPRGERAVITTTSFAF